MVAPARVEPLGERPPCKRGQVMPKGFRDFIMRGNLVDLAVAFVLRGAFATIVT